MSMAALTSDFVQLYFNRLTSEVVYVTNP
jgi:hypothetical protein